MGEAVRRAARVDVNHGEIVGALREVGCSVLDLSRHGSGCPDILVYVPRLCAYVLVEIKAPGKRTRLTPKQKEFHANWRGPVIVVESVEEALNLFGAQVAA